METTTEQGEFNGWSFFVILSKYFKLNSFPVLPEKKMTALFMKKREFSRWTWGKFLAAMSVEWVLFPLLQVYNINCYLHVNWEQQQQNSTGHMNHISSNKQWASNNRCPLISTTPLTLRSEQVPPSNKHFPLVDAAPQILALTRIRS